MPHLTVSEFEALTAASEHPDLLSLGAGRTAAALEQRLRALSEADLRRQLFGVYGQPVA